MIGHQQEPEVAERRQVAQQRTDDQFIDTFDRLYLDVHWESDVIGGLLLGAIALLSATVWLDRPLRADN